MVLMQLTKFCFPDRVRHFISKTWLDFPKKYFALDITVRNLMNNDLLYFYSEAMLSFCLKKKHWPSERNRFPSNDILDSSFGNWSNLYVSSASSIVRANVVFCTLTFPLWSTVRFGIIWKWISNRIYSIQKIIKNIITWHRTYFYYLWKSDNKLTSAFRWMYVNGPAPAPITKASSPSFRFICVREG